jgi:hypothetical protein
MRLVRDTCGPSGKIKIGDSFDNLPEQLNDLQCRLELMDLGCTLQPPEKRTVEVWNHTYSDWTGVELSQLELDQVVPVIPQLGRRANAMLWAAMNSILCGAWMRDCVDSYGPPPQMRQVWEYLSNLSGHADHVRIASRNAAVRNTAALVEC